MSEFKLSRICSEFDKGKFWIHQYGYDENNSPVSKKTEFRDYFYYSLEHVDELKDCYGLDVQEGVYKSIFDIDVCKVKYKSIKSKIALNRKYPEHIYEFDIEPESRYILDAISGQIYDSVNRPIPGILNVMLFKIFRIDNIDDFLIFFPIYQMFLGSTIIITSYKITELLGIKDKKIWNGKKFDGTLVVHGEQGIGDEILYSSMFPDLVNYHDNLIITTDSRLIPIMQRSFPKVNFINRYNNEVKILTLLMDFYQRFIK